MKLFLSFSLMFVLLSICLHTAFADQKVASDSNRDSEYQKCIKVQKALGDESAYFSCNTNYEIRKASQDPQYAVCVRQQVALGSDGFFAYSSCSLEEGREASKDPQYPICVKTLKSIKETDFIYSTCVNVKYREASKDPQYPICIKYREARGDRGAFRTCRDNKIREASKKGQNPAYVELSQIGESSFEELLGKPENPKIKIEEIKSDAQYFASKDPQYPVCVKMVKVWGLDYVNCEKKDIREASKDPQYPVCVKMVKAWGLDYVNCEKKDIREASKDPQYPVCLKMVKAWGLDYVNCEKKDIREVSIDPQYPVCVKMRQNLGDPYGYCEEKDIREASKDPQYPVCLKMRLEDGDLLAGINCQYEHVREASKDPQYPVCVKIMKELGEEYSSFHNCESESAREAVKDPGYITCVELEREFDTRFGDPLSVVKPPTVDCTKEGAISKAIEYEKTIVGYRVAPERVKTDFSNLYQIDYAGIQRMLTPLQSTEEAVREHSSEESEKAIKDMIQGAKNWWIGVDTKEKSQKSIQVK